MRGNFRSPWPITGTRNHIKAAALWAQGLFIIIEGFVLLDELIIILDIVPIMVAKRADVFKCKGKTGSIIGWKIIQFNTAPAVIAPKHRLTMGSVMLISSSEVYCRGSLDIGLQITEIIIRIE